MTPIQPGYTEITNTQPVGPFRVTNEELQAAEVPWNQYIPASDLETETVTIEEYVSGTVIIDEALAAGDAWELKKDAYKEIKDALRSTAFYDGFFPIGPIWFKHRYDPSVDGLRIIGKTRAIPYRYARYASQMRDVFHRRHPRDPYSPPRSITIPRFRHGTNPMFRTAPGQVMVIHPDEFQETPAVPADETDIELYRALWGNNDPFPQTTRHEEGPREESVQRTPEEG